MATNSTDVSNTNCHDGDHLINYTSSDWSLRMLKRHLCSSNNLQIDTRLIALQLLQSNSVLVNDLCNLASQDCGFPINNQVLLSLVVAIFTINNSSEVKSTVFANIPEICKSSQHLFFVMSQLRSDMGTKVCLSRFKRKCVHKWYNNKEPLDLCRTVFRCKSSCGWSHKDILRMAHVSPANEAVDLVMKYIVRGFPAVQKQREEKPEASEEFMKVYRYLEMVNTVRQSHDPIQVSTIVEELQLSPELIPTWLQKSKPVWVSLVKHMNVDDVLDYFGRLTNLGLLNRDGGCTQIVTSLLNSSAVENASSTELSYRLFLTLKFYQSLITSATKNHKITENRDIVSSLTAAFYKSLQSTRPTGLRYLLAVDVNRTSLVDSRPVVGSRYLNPIAAVEAVAVGLVQTEPACEVVALSDTCEPIRREDVKFGDLAFKLAKFMETRSHNISAPVDWALAMKKPVDVFVICSDDFNTDPSAGPKKSLERYCEQMKLPNTRLIHYSPTNVHSRIAGYNEKQILDVFGIEATTLDIMRSFAVGMLDD